jgi:hypothetical protein
MRQAVEHDLAVAAASECAAKADFRQAQSLMIRVATNLLGSSAVADVGGESQGWVLKGQCVAAAPCGM